MENRISVISIIIEDTAQAAAVNDLLHEYGSYIVGRMGIPYRERKVSIICIVMSDTSIEYVTVTNSKLSCESVCIFITLICITI